MKRRRKGEYIMPVNIDSIVHEPWWNRLPWEARGWLLTAFLPLWKCGGIASSWDALFDATGVNAKHDREELRHNITSAGVFVEHPGGALECPYIVAAWQAEREAGERRAKAGKAGGQKRARNNYSQSFETFWQAYPKHRRIAKKKCFASWQKRNGDDILQQVMDGLARWQASEDWARGYVPHATTWINQERWEAEPEPAKKPKTVGGVAHQYGEGQEV